MIYRFKKIKAFYYAKALFMMLYPFSLKRRRLKKIITDSDTRDTEVQFRVNYYNKLTKRHPLEGSKKTVAIGKFKLKDYSSAYYFDTLEYLRYFPKNYQFNPLFGDITFVPDAPSIVKSRPVGDNNQNSVLLNLDKYRHFNFINDPIKYEDKKDILVWRGHVSKLKQNRIDFLEKFHDHPLCDAGYTNNWDGNPDWKKGWLTIKDQLKYKFILCLEGVDVATNLKWVMSSNSVAVSTIPKFETWYMEGTLKPDYHYISIADDFSDLEDKINFYLNHPDKAKAIIANAHNHVNRFRDKKRERLISLLVLSKYFEMTSNDTKNGF
ncbi:glycosyl transferase family 90 [Tenuifilum thalassicum]|uniref:Glycosyltransferase n=1 Tax=Tenuifilum thalassicum TaxID=2590900 RepID=A0A7D3XMB4_9BACT|nr:glycosyl transferase family 90 [Tenuifilum thalassicum]QKG80995.1 glycosyltransferase [Tenuifilum thalassicum]